MVKRNAIATKLTKRCTQTQKRAFDVAVCHEVTQTLEREEVNQNQNKEVNQVFEEKTLNQNIFTVCSSGNVC